MRLIDADAFREFLEEIRQDYREEDTLSSGFAACLIETVQDEYLALAPTVDAVKVVHGRWVEVRGIPSVNRKDVPVVKCSKCEIYFCDLINNHHYMYHYCPNCGAKMDGDRNG